ncbi:MAG: hypothetical protein ABIF77_11455, partial [bacterium]
SGMGRPTMKRGGDHVLRRRQSVAAPLDEVFDSYARPENPAELTPPLPASMSSSRESGGGTTMSRSSTSPCRPLTDEGV